jgi:zinc transport system permease protein
MALGVIFLSRTRHYSQDAFTYLFGTILAVTTMDLIITGLVVLVAVALWRYWGRWAYATFDRELARSDALPCLSHDYLLSICLAVTTVVSIKLVGITLVAAFLVIPAAGARLLSRTFSGMTVYSIIIGMGSVFLGMLLSDSQDLPTGPAIILVQAAVFVLAMLFPRKN